MDLKEYIIDLALPETERWLPVINAEKENASAFFNSVRDEFTFVLEKKDYFFTEYKKAGGLYIDEMTTWADKLGIDPAEFVMINFQYEISQYLMGPFRNLGCTSAAYFSDTLGMVHIRNLDWELNGLQGATRKFSFKKEDRIFHTIGILGLIGALSGNVPGRYSVTLNFAPLKEMPIFNEYSPLILLRKVLEECNTFDEALEALSKIPIASNCLYLLSGIKKNESCIIERTQYDSVVRFTESDKQVLANSFCATKFLDNNVDVLTEDSEIREQVLFNKLKELSSEDSKEDVFNCLNEFPVDNASTLQKMMFLNNTGEILYK